MNKTARLEHTKFVLVHYEEEIKRVMARLAVQPDGIDNVLAALERMTAPDYVAPEDL